MVTPSPGEQAPAGSGQERGGVAGSAVQPVLWGMAFQPRRVWIHRAQETPPHLGPRRVRPDHPAGVRLGVPHRYLDQPRSGRLREGIALPGLGRPGLAEMACLGEAEGRI